MKRQLVALWVLLASMIPAAAQTPLDEVRTLLDEKNITALDERIARLHAEAQVDKDGTELRDIYATLFNTTHPERLETVDLWLEEKPDSAYALAAKAWASIKSVKMFASREYDSPGPPRDRVQLYVDALETALGLVEKTLAQSPDFVPSIDAWVLSRLFYFERPRSTERNDYIYATLMNASPNRDSVLRIIDAIDASFPVPFQEIVKACLRYAPQARDYDTDLCATEAALRHHVDDDLKQQALTELDTRSEPYLDDLKLETVLFTRGFFNQERSAYFVDTLKTLHRNSLQDRSDLKRFTLHGRRIASFLKDRSYADATRASALAFIDRALHDDPMDRILLDQKIRLHLETFKRSGQLEDLAAARAVWPDIMVYGQYRSDTWRLGVDLATADRLPFDILDQVGPMENSIAYARPSFGAALQSLIWMTAARDAAASQRKEQDGHRSPDLIRIIDGLKCPMLRAARVTDGLCRSKSVPWETCAPDTELYAQIQRVLNAGAEGSCQKVSDILLSDLEYEPQLLGRSTDN